MTDNSISKSNVPKRCLDHAKETLQCARLILDTGVSHNIAFHLSVLALEEIGKATLIQVGDSKNENERWSDSHLEDHERKLFWALWGGALKSNQFDPALTEQYQGISKRIHRQRLSAIYTSSEGTNADLGDAVTVDNAELVYNLGTTRLNSEIASLNSTRTPDPEHTALLDWFLKATKDRRLRREIFSPISMGELNQLKDISKWVRWLKESIENTKKEAAEIAQTELKRVAGGEDLKWSMTVRFVTGSHKFKQKALNGWNERATWVKLNTVQGKEDAIDVTILQPASVTAEQLWPIGVHTASWLLNALNIATMGYFTWQKAEFIGTPFRKVVDLERKGFDVVLETKPNLKVDWRGGYISDDELIKAQYVLASQFDKANDSFFEPYAQGMILLSKCDLFFRTEAETTKLFFKSIKELLLLWNKWNGESDIKHIIQEILPHLKDQSIWATLDLVQSEDQTETYAKQFTLEHVGILKLTADQLILNFTLENMRKQFPKK